ncbi:precorrin-8X methylmutase [Thermoproteus tenax]|nr:precorrin-8X methylmutase [Thermoproteus tenax]
MVKAILVNHGSRRGAFNELMTEIARQLSEDLGIRVEVGYNEYADPNWRELLAKSQEDVIVILAFLGPGNHVYRDILGELGVEPGKWAMSKFGRRIYVTPPLGDSPLVYSAILARVRRALGESAPTVVQDPDEIEEESMGFVAKALRLNLDDWRDRLKARAAYASGNLEIAKMVEVKGEVKRAVEEWTSAGGPLAADVAMVAAGLRYNNVEIAAKTPVEVRGTTRTYAGMKKLLSELGSAGIVVGNAPTALAAVVEECRGGREIPFIVAAPVGFANAASVKEEALRCNLPSVVVRGTYGGSGVAAALFNELLRP